MYLIKMGWQRSKVEEARFKEEERSRSREAQI
jgi:hypothetical protein